MVERRPGVAAARTATAAQRAEAGAAASSGMVAHGAADAVLTVVLPLGGPILVGLFFAAGICLTDGVPGIRSLVSIPAGLSAYLRRRFLLASTAGNVLYVALLLAIAVGLLELVGLVAE